VPPRAIFPADHRQQPNRGTESVGQRKSTVADRSQPPTIVCINRADDDIGVPFTRLVRALQIYVDRHVAPAWGTPARLVEADKPIKGAWALIFLDHADKAEALGYHNITVNGEPLGRVFVTSARDNDEPVSVVASHELAEMLVDPADNLWALGPDGRLYAYEICDSVEEEHFEINGIAVSDFVYPAYFEAHRRPKTARFDHLDKVKRPFQVLPNGFLKYHDGDKIGTKFSSKRKEKRFAKEDRRYHRSELRPALPPNKRK
jgi:hypothetical protein